MSKRTSKHAAKVVEPDELRFSERNFLTLPPPAEGRRYYRPENGPKGFRLMVTANGYRSFCVIYRPRTGGAARAFTIGSAADFSFKKAKDRAEDIRGQVAAGRDPFAEARAAKLPKAGGPVSVRECINYFVAANRERLDSKTIQAYEQTRDAFPRRFMDSPAEDLSPALFREAVREATRAEIMQNRHLSRLKAVLRFAHSEEKIRRLPSLLGMRRPHTERKRERVLSADEIRAMWQAVDAIIPEMPRGGRAFGASVRLMLLLGTRLGETLLATWDELDLEGAKPRSEAIPRGQPTWYIPAEHRKGERDRKRPHWVPLGPLAVSILRDLHEVTGDKPEVFHKSAYSSRTYMLGKLLDAMKLVGCSEAWTYHDERRTMSSNLGEMGCPDEMNDLILGHVKRGVLAHYDHSKRVAERAEWLRRWEDKVRDIVGLATERPTALLHLYVAAGGLPEIRTAREPERGRRYVGAFPALEAVRKAEDLTRAALSR